MKLIIGFLAGLISTAAIGVAAQCLQDGGLTPMVRIIDARSKQLLLQCRVTITMFDGHQIACDRG